MWRGACDLSYPWPWYCFHRFLLAHFLHGRIVLLLILGHEHLQRAPCVREDKLNELFVAELALARGEEMMEQVENLSKVLISSSVVLQCLSGLGNLSSSPDQP